MNCRRDDDENLEIALNAYVLHVASCQTCGNRVPKLDGQRIWRTSNVACSRPCWERLTGRRWKEGVDWELYGEPTRA